MKYMYTADMCSACEKLKKEYREQGIEFVERHASRLKTPGNDRDDIDLDAFVQLTMNNMQLPVVVERG
jgi:glutaredoxin